MKNFEERKAEIFRRSEERIKERKAKRNHILVVCITFCFILTILSVTILPTVFPTETDSFVSVDITAPLYWWKEFSTYKIGTVANSTSTMHKIHSKPFELSDFSTDKMVDSAKDCMNEILVVLENLRQDFISDKTSNKDAWYSIIQLLPESYNQKRTVTLNYENAISMYYSRRNHKLSEWHVFCDWILDLPYFKELFSLDENE